MAFRVAVSSLFRRSVAATPAATRAFATSSGSSGATAVATSLTSAAALRNAVGSALMFSGVGAKLAMDNFVQQAKCDTKFDSIEETESDVTAQEDTAAKDAPSIHNRADELYSNGRLADVYELLNEDPSTKSDASLLYRLAQTTHKLSLVAPQPERRRVLNDEALLVVMKAAEEAAGKKSTSKSDRADILSLYGTIIQHRSYRKQGTERQNLMTLAQEHMMAAYREDAESFNANQALADLHFEQATERTELGRKCLTGANVWDKSNNHKLSETDQESLWRATARHAYVALKANPNDVNCMNYMAQAKFAIGDLQTAKKYTLQAVAAEPQAKFEDEKRAAKDARELMLKINAILADSK